MLDYNTTNPLDLASGNNEEDISPGASNIGKKKPRLANMNNNKEDIRPADIDKERLAILNWRL